MSAADIRVDLRSDPRLLCAVRGLVRGYVTAWGVSEERAGEVVLAVDEACTNAMRHSYQGDTGRTLELVLGANETWIELVLRDEGLPAPASCTQPKAPAAADRSTLKPGGLGVQLIYQVFDEVCFTPGGQQGNRVAMRLKRPAARQDESKEHA